MMKIYVASSWRNMIQPAVVRILRKCGHEVYDFKNPPNRSGFGWEQVAPNWKQNGKNTVTAEQWRTMLAHPLAAAGYAEDMAALDKCDAVVYVLPCGRSASWELGYAMGRGKKSYVLAIGETEPELMFRNAKIFGNLHDLFDEFALPGSGLERIDFGADGNPPAPLR